MGSFETALFLLRHFCEIMDSPEQPSYCDLWDGTFNAMFHSANVVLGIGYSMPQNFEQGFVCMKFFISFGLALNLLWGFDVVLCKSPSIVIWNTCIEMLPKSEHICKRT